MKKGSQADPGRKEQIVQVALKLFFENGYEGTSMRLIAEHAHCAVGLTYNYFASKEMVLDAAIEMFFRSYEEQMRQIVEAGRDDPTFTLTSFLDYIDAATQEFRAQYSSALHWSLLGAIREHTILVMRKYIRLILQDYIDNGVMQQPEVGLEGAVNTIAFAFGGSILYQDKQTYQAQKGALKRLIPMLLGVEG